MATLSKIIVSSLLGLLFLSCNFTGSFGTGENGNGNVITQQRSVSESFHTVHASSGLDVYLTQDATESIAVQADENLHDLIVTDLNDGILTITTSKNIGNASAKKVHLNVTNLKQIKATSGSDVFSTNTIVADYLDVSATSGADVQLSLEANNVTSNATSGSDISLSGTTKILSTNASSGADIKAKDLKAEQVSANASSGSDITVSVITELNASATSGGDIKYYGNPTSISASENVTKKSD